jgi:hypothetical protein
MPYQLPEISIAPAKGGTVEGKNIARSIAGMSALTWSGEAIPGGYATDAWAFGTLAGHKVLVVLAETDADKKVTIHLRGDNKIALFGLVASSTSRRALVDALVPGTEPLLYVD